jgi:hypothetical protein
MNKPAAVQWAVLFLSAVLCGSSATNRVIAAGQETSVSTTVENESTHQPAAAVADTVSAKIALEKAQAERAKTRPTKEVTWLGVSTEEASEALAEQLGLPAGEGLLINYVAPESPAAKAGLKKNDVLVGFGQQMLVHPAQLRKLVKMHKDGEEVKVAYFRGGKKDTASVILARTTRLSMFEGEDNWKEGLQNLNLQLKELKIGEDMKGQMQTLHEALARSGIDRQKLKIEIHQALRDALRGMTNGNWAAGKVGKEIEELARSGVEMDKDTTVTVKKDRKSVQTIVKTDDSGTYVIVAGPGKRLTAHDAKGKLLFDGEVETKEQQDKVPREVWEKVKPMLEQLGSGRIELREEEEESDDSVR